MRANRCSIKTRKINGWAAVTLANSQIEVTLLPDKGADIYSFVDVASGVDVLVKTPWGLLPPVSPARHGSEDDVFLHNYEGAWQELFPNCFTPCTYRGKQIPLHGEVATLPWTLRVDQETDELVQITLEARCRLLPLRLTRSMRLSALSPTLVIEETVRNEGDERLQFVWGHHPVLGAPFLEAGCRIETGPCDMHTPKQSYEPASASLAAGQRAKWPHALRVDGGLADLRQVSGPEAGTHDHAYLTGFKRGWIEVENPRLALAFRLEWDPEVFRWIINWRPFGGSHRAPLEGIYGMGVELWSSGSNLEGAIEAGDALALEAGCSLETSFRASLRHTHTSTPNDGRT